MDKHTKYFSYFLVSLLAFRIIYILFLPIIPQEAYYWYYAQYPDFSYFDHPPMTAYSIWFGTTLFGNTVFGIKFMAVIWSLLTNLFLFLTVRRALHKEPEKASRIGFITVLFYNLTVFAHFYSLLMVPDTPLIFFWLLTLYFFQEIILSGKKLYWLWAGISMGLGFISKYTIVALLPAFFIVMLMRKDLHHWFKSPFPYLAILLMGIVILPVILWNQQHNWASLSFQFSERASNLNRFQTKYILQLLASQLLLLTPLAFVFFIRTGLKLKTIWQRYEHIFFLLLSGAFLIGGFTLISMRSLVKMNWLLPGYLGLFMGTALFYASQIDWRSRWLKAGISFSAVLITAIHFVQLVPNVPLGEGNTWSGWDDASQEIYQIQQEYGGSDRCFLFANSYKSAALLKFYLPDQQDTFAQNIYGKSALQFDIWGIPDSLKGKDALYIFTDRREYKNDLKYVRPFFESVTSLKEFNYSFNTDTHVRTIYCYYAKNYKPDNQ